MRNLFLIGLGPFLISFAAATPASVTDRMQSVLTQAGLSLPASDLAAYEAAGGTVDELREYATQTDSHGRRLLSNLTGEACNPGGKHSALGMLREAGGTPEYLRSVSSLSLRSGEPLPCGEVVSAVNVMRSLRSDEPEADFPDASELQSLLNRADRNGRDVFDMASAFNMSRLPLDENLRFTDGEDNEDLAVVIMGTRDQGGALATTHARELLSSIGEHYKLRFHMVPTEEDACEALSQHRGIKLLLLAGHGVPRGLSFGDVDPATGRAQFPENYSLDPSDESFKSCLDNRLHPSARVALISCSTGGPVEPGEENMGQFVARISGRPVTAPFSPIRFDTLRINSFSPFDITMFQFVGNVDASRQFTPAAAP